MRENVIKNIFNTKKFKEKSHNGSGNLSKIRPFSSNDFKTPIDFIDYVIIEPTQSIGYHTHGNNEEIYFILKGNGIMIINQKEFPVTTGDIILNSLNDSHSLYNYSDENIEVFIFQVRVS